MNVIQKKNEPAFFIARTYQHDFFIARTCLCCYCAYSSKKKLLFCIARTCVCSYGANHEKKILLLHELDKKLIRNLYRIYQLNTWEFFFLFYCANCQKKIFLLHERNETASCSYCANSKKIIFYTARTQSRAPKKFIPNISVTNIKKKETFLIVPTIKKKKFFTARTE